MTDEILKRLEARLDRRSFLRGSGLAAAALLGVAAASPLIAFAQTQDPPPPAKKKDEPEKKDEKIDEKKDEKKDNEKDGSGDEDPTKVTKIDADGNEYRQCPECGSNMYRQGRTWTCENCGYSYIE